MGDEKHNNPEEVERTHKLTKLQNGEWATNCYVCGRLYQMSELILCDHSDDYGDDAERVYLCDACLEMCGS